MYSHKPHKAAAVLSRIVYAMRMLRSVRQIADRTYARHLLQASKQQVPAMPMGMLTD